MYLQTKNRFSLRTKSLIGPDILLPLTVPFSTQPSCDCRLSAGASPRLSVASGDIRVLNYLAAQHGLNTALSALLPPLA
jgi:phosphate transport system permease protein